VVSLQRAIALLSGQGDGAAGSRVTDELFRDPATLGWAYQLWNAEQKDRVFAGVRKRGQKVGGDDLIAATQLYTAPHLVQCLVQNSLGATWMAMHPRSRLWEQWPYFVARADRPRIEPKPVADLRVLDPACGSGHFLLEAFDLLFAMYEEEGRLTDSEAIARSILQRNLYGIDIDARAIQLCEALLWMKARARAPGIDGAPANLLAVSRPYQLDDDEVERFLAAHPEAEPERPWLATAFHGLAHAGELGALLRLAPEAEPVELDPADGPLFEATIRPRAADPLVESILDFVEAERGAAETQPARALCRVLAERFDVVAMNPPYAGFRTLAAHVKEYLSATEPEAKLDLYVAFVRRFYRLLAPGGRLAAVTPASWTTSSSIVALRRRVLREGGPVLVTALGQRVFDTAPLLFVALAVLGRGQRPAGGHFVTLRPATGGGAQALRRAVASGGRRWPCRVVADLDSAPFLPVAPIELLESAAERPSMQSFFSFVDGIWTGDSERDVREGWEVEPGDRSWAVASGGQGYARWYASTRRRLRAEHVGRFVARVDRSLGFEYPRVAGGNLSGRVFGERALGSETARATAEGSVALAGVVSVLPKPGIHARRIDEAVAMFNSRVGALWLRTLSSGLNFNPGYAARIPLGASAPGAPLAELVTAAVRLKRELARYDLCADDFDPDVLAPAAQTGLARFVRDRVTAQLEAQAELLEVELAVDRALAEQLGLSPASLQAIDEELGLPAAALPEEGPAPIGQADRPASDDVPERGLPTESPLESVALAQRIHPRAVLAASLGGPEPDGGADRLGRAARALRQSAESRLVADYLVASALSLFGHRFPSEASQPRATAAGERLPELLVLDSILGEAPALTAMRRALERDFDGVDLAQTEMELASLLGKPLDRWLRQELFGHHIKLHRRRPLIWQLQTRPSTGKQPPALTVWLYARRIDADTLPKLRSQVVRPLQQRVATELAAEPTAAQADRLRAAEADLADFDERLGAVVAEGFAHAELGPILGSERLDRWCGAGPDEPPPPDAAHFTRREGQYRPRVDDGIRVNVAPLQRALLLSREVLSRRDVDAAILDRARWRGELRRRCRAGELDRLPWWPTPPR
jgi:SAM-dependent methyltransferase